MGAHARLSPSSAKRWIACPGSVILADRIKPVDKGSVYAAEGTWMHDVADIALKCWAAGNPITVPTVGTRHQIEGYSLVWDSSMTDAVSVYLRYVVGLKAPMWWSELKVRVDSEVWGTSDFIGWHPERRHLDVVDLKGGRNVKVPADDPQLRLYVLGVARKLWLNPLTATCHIVQPRGGEPITRIARFSYRLELDPWYSSVVVPAEQRIADSVEEYVPGDYCFFCKVHPWCPAHQVKRLDQAKEDFSQFFVV